jgi:hypothetical protein
MECSNVYLVFHCVASFILKAQSFSKGIIFQNKTCENYPKMSFVINFWAKSSANHLDSKILGNSGSKCTDVGIRNITIQLFGKLCDRIFFLQPVCINFFNYISYINLSFCVDYDRLFVKTNTVNRNDSIVI